MLRLIASICAGASLGAVLRWGLGLWLNTLFPLIPPGTWLANLLGGYLMGVSLGVFSCYVNLPAEWRLFVMTGFLGGLTTFSTFSGEVVLLMQQGRLMWAMLAIAAHVLGSLALTFLGLASVSAWRAFMH